MPWLAWAAVLLATGPASAASPLTLEVQPLLGNGTPAVDGWMSAYVHIENHSSQVMRGTLSVNAELSWAREVNLGRLQGLGATRSTKLDEAVPPTPPSSGQADAREVPKAPPRYFRPQPPMLALRGAHPNHRHHGDGLYDENGMLRCRYPRECVPGIDGVVLKSGYKVHGRILRLQQILVPKPQWFLEIRFDRIERNGVEQPIALRPGANDIILQYPASGQVTLHQLLIIPDIAAEG